MLLLVDMFVVTIGVEDLGVIVVVLGFFDVLTSVVLVLEDVFVTDETDVVETEDVLASLLFVEDPLVNCDVNVDAVESIVDVEFCSKVEIVCVLIIDDLSCVDVVNLVEVDCVEGKIVVVEDIVVITFVDITGLVVEELLIVVTVVVICFVTFWVVVGVEDRDIMVLVVVKVVLDASVETVVVSADDNVPFVVPVVGL